MARPIELRSYAKINLYLDILDRRDDGYHNILTIFHTIDLHDTLSFEKDPQEIRLTCDTPQLDTGADNLILKAAHLLQSYTRSNQGAIIHLQKRIPIAAGLAGGSGNAAATLSALNTLWDLDLDDAELAKLAATLGADVPYCLKGGPMAATGRGDQLTPIALPQDLHFILIHPKITVSTQWVYNHPDLPRTNDPETIAKKKAKFQQALQAMQQGKFQDQTYNAMEKVVFKEHPQLQAQKEQLQKADCTTATMSGSGPTLIGICQDRQQAKDIAVQFDDANVVGTTDKALSD